VEQLERDCQQVLSLHHLRYFHRCYGMGRTQGFEGK